LKPSSPFRDTIVLFALRLLESGPPIRAVASVVGSG
jgi:hypothetical protein